MRRVVASIVAILILCTSVTTAFAAEGKVTYSGNAGKFIFEPGSEYSPTDLFPNFKDVMPGDTLTQKITVRNDADNGVKEKIYMRALGAHEASVAFLSQLGMTVTKSVENEMAYMFDAAADETAQLTDWVCLGTLYSGGEVNLDVTLSVPVELSNEYQEQIGYLDWEFRIEEFPIEDDDPEPPKTGDDTSMGVWAGLMLGSVFVLYLLFFWKKNRKEER